VLFNADIVHANRDLIGEEHLGLLSRRRFKSITPSSSAYILHLGVKRTFPDLAHHTVWHPENPNDELDRIISSPVPSDRGCALRGAMRSALMRLSLMTLPIASVP